MLEDATGIYGGRLDVEFGDGTYIDQSGTITIDTDAEFLQGLSDVNQFRVIWDNLCHEKWHDKHTDLEGKKDIHDEYKDERDSTRAGKVAGKMQNVVEDAYIDYQRCEDFPGMKGTNALLEDIVMEDDGMNPPMGDIDPRQQRQAGMIQLLRGGRVKGYDDASPGAQDYLAWAKDKLEHARTTHDYDERVDVVRELADRLLDEVEDPPEPPDLNGGLSDDPNPDGDCEGDEADPGNADPNDAESDADPNDVYDDDEVKPHPVDADDDDPEQDDDEAGGTGSSDDEPRDEDGEDGSNGDTGNDGDEDGQQAADDESDDDEGQGSSDDGGDDHADAKDDLSDMSDDEGSDVKGRHGQIDDPYEPSKTDRGQFDRLKREEKLPTDSIEKRVRERDDAISDLDANQQVMVDEAQNMAAESDVIEDTVDEFRRIRSRVNTTPAEDGAGVHIDNAISRHAGDMSVDNYHTRTERMEQGGRAVGVTLDTSGSMTPFGVSISPIDEARVAVAAIGFAADTIGDEFVATSFKSYDDHLNAQERTDARKKKVKMENKDTKPDDANGYVPDDLIQRKIITPPGEPFEWEHIADTKANGGTPTAHAILDMTHILDRVERNDKLQIVITDGQANADLDNWEYNINQTDASAAADDARKTIRQAEDQGIEVVGVALGNDIEPSYMDSVFGDSYIMSQPDTLAEDLIDLYQSKLDVRL